MNFEPLAKEEIMSSDLVIAGIAALFLLVYLAYAIIRPEKF
jgi:K+-transporting ATPase KdpF subunit